MNVFFEFFIKTFLRGVGLGGGLRLILSLILRRDFTLIGLINCMIFGGFIYFAITLWLVWGWL